MKRFVAIPSSRDLIVKWAEAMVAARSVGRRIEVADAWIAATALLYDAPLVTNNPRRLRRGAWAEARALNANASVAVQARVVALDIRSNYGNRAMTVAAQNVGDER